MITSFLSWPEVGGLLFLIAGLFFARRELANRQPVDKLIALGPVLIAVAAAVFGVEHFLFVRFMATGVPSWMPGHLFWAYFVGFALLCTAVSLTVKRYVRLSATLFGLMLFLFVLLIHIPAIAGDPRDRIKWAVALRDLAFGGGAWALAASWNRNVNDRWSDTQANIGRVCVAVPVIFFAVEHFLHPDFAPGVPLNKMTPGWIPFISLWGYLTGAILLGAGICLLLKVRVRVAAAGLGLLLILLVLLLYLPILVTSPQQITEATNYVADTLLFAGIVLGAARARL